VDAVRIAEAFELGGGARLSDGPVARGKQGLVWLLTTSDGDWAVKQAFGEVTEPDARLSTAFQEAAYDAGVPTPPIRRTEDGTVFATVDGIPLRVYGWVDVGAPDPRLDPALVGDVVARMHQVVLPAGEPLDAWSHEAVGADRWDALVARLRAAEAPFAARLADLRDELVALETWMEPPERLQTCHRDLWADNLLPTPDGGVCVLDWENSGPADPSHELGYVLFEFGHTDPGRARTLVESYHAAGGPGGVDRPGHFSMLIAQLGHITEIAGNDWLDPNPRSPDRSDSTAWISETLDDPHRREVLAGLLRAVSGS